MKLTIDEDRFDSFQIRVLNEIIRTVRDGLKGAGVTGDSELEEFTGNIVFSIAAIVDGSRIMELDGQPVVPFLTFQTDRDGDELITANGGSWMHEYACSAVDEMFSEENEDDA